MITETLKQTEIELLRRTNENNGKLKAVRNIMELLGRIDFEAEVLPENDRERMIRLLTSLKGEALAEDEAEVVREITVK